MTTIISKTILGCTLITSTAMAANYTCVNLDRNVELTINFLSATAAEVDVKSPFKKHLSCEVNDYTNDTETIKGLTCGNSEEIPDILAINEKTMKGMIEVSDQPHYDLECK